MKGPPKRRQNQRLWSAKDSSFLFTPAAGGLFDACFPPFPLTCFFFFLEQMRHTRLEMDRLERFLPS